MSARPVLDGFPPPARPRAPRLLAIVDVDVCATREVEPMAAVGIAAEAGAPAVLLRAKNCDEKTVRIMAEQAVRFAHHAGARALLSGHAELAVALGFDGVHLPFAQCLDAAAAGQAGLLVGVSVHGLAELQQAQRAGAHYVTVSPVWTSESKAYAQQPLGLEGLAALSRAATLPVLALSGVTPERVADVRRAGAFGVAAMGPFSGSGGGAAARAFNAALRRVAS